MVGRTCLNMIGIKTRPSSCNRVFPWCDDENVPECDEDNVSNIVDNQLDASAEGSTDHNDLIVSRIFSISQQSLVTDTRPTINVPYPDHPRSTQEGCV